MKTVLVLFVLGCTILLSSSNTPTPQKYLDKAVLNADKVAGFAGIALSLELENPPLKKNGKVTTRKEIIDAKIEFSENIVNELRLLASTPDSRDIVTSSIALHEFVIAAYETDYKELAKLYDEGAPKEQIIALDNAIRKKYTSMFELHYENLIRGGKLYASRHRININWKQV